MSVTSWNGGKATALRAALRLTVDELAQRIDSSPRSISKWEQQQDVIPAIARQQALTQLLGNATGDERERFTLLLKEQGDDHGRH